MPPFAASSGRRLLVVANGIGVGHASSHARRRLGPSPVLPPAVGQRRRQLSSSSLPAGIETEGTPLVANGLEMASLFVPSVDGKHRLHVKRVREMEQARPDTTGSCIH